MTFGLGVPSVCNGLSQVEYIILKFQKKYGYFIYFLISTRRVRTVHVRDNTSTQLCNNNNILLGSIYYLRTRWHAGRRENRTAAPRDGGVVMLRAHDCNDQVEIEARLL